MLARKDDTRRPGLGEDIVLYAQQHDCAQQPVERKPPMPTVTTTFISTAPPPLRPAGALPLLRALEQDPRATRAQIRAEIPG